MAGSYNHAVDKRTGKLLRPEYFHGMIENRGDTYEMAEEMYGMIWYLAEGNAARVEAARDAYQEGLESSPGTDGELPED